MDNLDKKRQLTTSGDGPTSGIRVTRRQFLRGAALTAGCLAVSAGQRLLGTAPDATAQEPAPRAYLPFVSKSSSQPRPKIVHIHNDQATSWDFSTGWYGDYVRQTAVDQMVEQGLMELAGTTSVAQAWAAILPDYLPSQKIAMKINLNNSGDCADSDNAIDALIEPVNALIGSLIQAGVHEDDVWVYDASRRMPERFYGRRQYRQALYIDRYGCADDTATFSHVNESLRVDFSHPAMVTDRWLTDLLYQATYLINMPILKKHSLHPVTLGFKNHFGSLDNLGGGGDDNPHWYIDPSDGRYNPDFSPLVDINANPNIADKTVLTVGDGLFGAPSVGATPVSWTSFGGASNSLLFSRDPVAIDCVMCDLLDAEWGIEEAAYEYLMLAEERGLGTFEKGDPWSAGYTKFQYNHIDL
jgi:hypothetical protein